MVAAHYTDSFNITGMTDSGQCVQMIGPGATKGQQLLYSGSSGLKQILTELE